MPKSNFELIVEAVNAQKQVIAVYEGHRRMMCPHVIGYKRGRPQSLFYQFGGTSRSGLKLPGHPENWRCIPVEEMTGVKVIDGPWFTSWNHSRPQTCIDRIVAIVAY